ncbi:MAG: hypothetical protein KAU50_04215 [Candidatus Marinimicrobia bacterium]|nr:hypothetical protein [Candidatus Neomarinimicrobiota bacterium]
MAKSTSSAVPPIFAPLELSGVSATSHTLRLGDEKVWIHVYEREGSTLTFVNLHDDENTSAEAARSYISKNGGRLIELRHGRGRDVVIRRREYHAQFDPNRMFTAAGLSKSLSWNGKLTEENVQLGLEFSTAIAQIIDIDHEPVIIAVHNNTQGRLTIRDFQPGQWYGDDAKQVNISRGRDSDDFFFTNSPQIFAGLSRLQYNVALMSDDPPDRGTLGRRVNSQGGTYVNVEAQHGHLKEQIEMLESLVQVIASIAANRN